LGLAILNVTTALKAQEAKHEPGTISVTGTGRVHAQPDIAEIQFSVVTEAPTAAGALQTNNASATRLLQVLNERGVAQKDRQTIQVQVSPLYSAPQPRAGLRGELTSDVVQRIVGYRVENTVRVTARQLDKFGPLLDALIEGGANQLRGISFRVEDEGGLLDKARTAAMQDALHKARLLAESVDARVGAPRKIEEHAGRVAPPPRPYLGGPLAAAAAVPVAAGEQELTSTVSVVFELLSGKRGAP
jgi:uncharacterized protein YggE